MKTKYFFVEAEFYKYGGQSAFIDSRFCKEKPKSYCRKNPVMAAFKIWLEDEELAYGLVASIKSGTASIGNISEFLHAVKEKEAA